jgi:hypothetical protein
LARRRASVVMESLCNTLERMLPGVTRGIRFQLTSCGERQPESTPERSRRVAIYLPTKAPPPPIPPFPVPPTLPVTIPLRCLFRPSAHGFRFVNFFTLPTAITAPLSRLGIPIGSGAYGLCGGMSLLAGDHFSFSVAIPTTSTVPAIGSPLYNKLVARQLDSLNLNLSSIGSGFGAPVLKFFDWMGRADRGAGSTAALTTAELRRVTAALRRSRLVVIGLVLVSRSTGALTDNHQVLVHCMTRHSPSRADLHIYDPNHPSRDDIRIEVQTVGGETLSTHVAPSGAGATRGPIRGFFVMPFTPKRP